MIVLGRVNAAAAAAVDQGRVRAHERQRVGVDQVLGARGERHVQRHHVAGGQQLGQRRDRGDAELAGPGGRGARRPGDDPQAERGGAPRDQRAGPAEADDAEHRAGDPLRADRPRGPAAVPDVTIADVQVAQQREGHRDRVVGHLDVAVAGGVGNRHPGRREGVGVQVVVAGRGDGDDAQPGQRGDVGGGQPGGRGDGEADDVGAGRDRAGDVDVVGVGPAPLGLERLREGRSETGQDLLVAGPGGEDDPAPAAGSDGFPGDRGQSL
jgi:hypothetical protein